MWVRDVFTAVSGHMGVGDPPGVPVWISFLVANSTVDFFFGVGGKKRGGGLQFESEQIAIAVGFFF